jgi:hypothetical protein
MTKKELNKLNDEVAMMIKSVDDLSHRFKTYGNNIRQFAEEYEREEQVTDILLCSMRLVGRLKALHYITTWANTGQIHSKKK